MENKDMGLLALQTLPTNDTYMLLSVIGSPVDIVYGVYYLIWLHEELEVFLLCSYPINKTTFLDLLYLSNRIGSSQMGDMAIME